MNTKHAFLVAVLGCVACGDVAGTPVGSDALPSAQVAAGNPNNMAQMGPGGPWVLSQDCETFPCDGGIEPPMGNIRRPVVPTRSSLLWSNSALIKWSAPVAAVDCSFSLWGDSWTYTARTADDGTTAATVAVGGQSAAQASTIDDVSGALGEVSIAYMYNGFAGRVYVSANKLCAASVGLEWVSDAPLPRGFNAPAPFRATGCSKAPVVNFPGCVAP